MCERECLHSLTHWHTRNSHTLSQSSKLFVLYPEGFSPRVDPPFGLSLLADGRLAALAAVVVVVLAIIAVLVAVLGCANTAT